MRNLLSGGVTHSLRTSALLNFLRKHLKKKNGNVNLINPQYAWKIEKKPYCSTVDCGTVSRSIIRIGPWGLFYCFQSAAFAAAIVSTSISQLHVINPYLLFSLFGIGSVCLDCQMEKIPASRYGQFLQNW